MTLTMYHCPRCGQFKNVSDPMEARCYCVSYFQTGNASYVEMELADDRHGSVVIVPVQLDMEESER